MLQNLHVKNLALIDEVEVDFGPGLNILTGETGAGKSIILGSVNLALGGRYNADMLRKGARFGLVELMFQLKSGVDPSAGRNGYLSGRRDADLKPEIDGRQKCQQDQWRDGDDGSTAGCGKSPD